MERDIYLLVANHLRDIHHSLQSKIIESKAHNPKWAVEKENSMVVELSPLYGLVVLLERLASGQEQQQATVYMPGMGEE